MKKTLHFALSKELTRYILVGLVNTAIGFGAISACMALGMGDVSANVIGYALGLISSFFLNGKWTFSQAKLTSKEAFRFACIFAVSYLCNLAVVLILVEKILCERHLAQFLGMCTYTGLSYLGMKFLVFTRPKSTETPTA